MPGRIDLHACLVGSGCEEGRPLVCLVKGAPATAVPVAVPAAISRSPVGGGRWRQGEISPALPVVFIHLWRDEVVDTWKKSSTIEKRNVVDLAEGRSVCRSVGRLLSKPASKGISNQGRSTCGARCRRNREPSLQNNWLIYCNGTNEIEMQAKTNQNNMAILSWAKVLEEKTWSGGRGKAELEGYAWSARPKTVTREALVGVSQGTTTCNPVQGCSPPPRSPTIEKAVRWPRSRQTAGITVTMLFGSIRPLASIFEMFATILLLTCCYCCCEGRRTHTKSYSSGMILPCRDFIIARPRVLPSIRRGDPSCYWAAVSLARNPAGH